MNEKIIINSFKLNVLKSVSTYCDEEIDLCAIGKRMYTTFYLYH